MPLESVVQLPGLGFCPHWSLVVQLELVQESCSLTVIAAKLIGDLDESNTRYFTRSLRA